MTATYPFHATLKWPARDGLPDVMVNVYAETAAELADRWSEAIEAARAVVPVVRVEAVPAPQVERPRRQPQPEPHYQPEAVANVSCLHGSDDWRTSDYGGWYIPECRCRLTPEGEVKARSQGRVSQMRPGDGRFYKSRAAGGAR